MSCIIQKKENVAIIAAFIKRLLDQGYNSFGFEADHCVFDTFKDCKRTEFYSEHLIYDKLYEANFEAYNKRYEKLGENLTWKDYKDTESFKYEDNDIWEPRVIVNNTDAVQEWHYKVLKCIHFLMYQVSDFSDNDFIYKALESLEAKLAMFIIVHSSIYRNIEWE